VSATLRDVLEEATADLDGVETVPSGDGVEWRRGGRPFAAVSGDAAEFHLDAPVARAATRTPDARPADRGPDWVRFSPAALDGHAVDRAMAWLASAWRRAGD
jgi:acyl dehydratase